MGRLCVTVSQDLSKPVLNVCVPKTRIRLANTSASRARLTISVRPGATVGTTVCVNWGFMRTDWTDWTIA